ncbi:Tetratricopeptide-like helical [Botryosphaeria dothidea]|uniref:Tetratricopeptide-like helical n=1 Tax=Botryosphaeria dothidea TaxID=55169 RepID=A0A8H4IPY3_9PEZI|nr:Tetratricopeptide-like helical [Botryosphaeria dothidea]KAF4305160.1 Tetratricopeptide-like helical [Botryosphaeria dothidea]
MPKKKQFLPSNSKQAARGKKKEPEPETEDDFLDAADEFEKSAGKWRAGDAAKSARFFQRAIDAYTAGLQKFPQSFDLAYNKALLEYQIAQDLSIAAQIGPPLVDLLRQALESHRFALSLNPNNLDILFNTANVLSDLADRVSKGEAIQLLQESVQHIRHCLERQVQEYESLQAAFQAANSGDASGGVVLPSESAQDKSSSGSSGEEYATVEEAVTESAILDSIFFMANIIADLLGVLPADKLETISKDVELVVGFFTSGALWPYWEKLDHTTPQSDSTPTLSLSLSAVPPKAAQAESSEYESAVAEGSLASARLFSAISEVEFRRGERSSASWYLAVLTKFAETNPALNPDVHSALIDALFSIADATAPAGGAQGEAAYIEQAPSVPAVATDEGAANLPPAAALDQVNDAWTDDATHADVLKRAYEVLTTALAAGVVPANKVPQLYVALGDVHWRLRNACVNDDQLNLAEAVTQARRAERCWGEAEAKARAVGVACAEEKVEAAGKADVSTLLRGAGGGGVVVGEARESVLMAVQEMREETLLDDIVSRHVLKLLGAA